MFKKFIHNYTLFFSYLNKNYLEKNKTKFEKLKENLAALFILIYQRPNLYDIWLNEILMVLVVIKIKPFPKEIIDAIKFIDMFIFQRSMMIKTQVFPEPVYQHYYIDFLMGNRNEYPPRLTISNLIESRNALVYIFRYSRNTGQVLKNERTFHNNLIFQYFSQPLY